MPRVSAPTMPVTATQQLPTIKIMKAMKVTKVTTMAMATMNPTSMKEIILSPTFSR